MIALVGDDFLDTLTDLFGGLIVDQLVHVGEVLVDRGKRRVDALGVALGPTVQGHADDSSGLPGPPGSAHRWLRNRSASDVTRLLHRPAPRS